MLREATFWELKTPDIRKLFPANLWPALSVLRHTSPTLSATARQSSVRVSRHPAKITSVAEGPTSFGPKRARMGCENGPRLVSENTHAAQPNFVVGHNYSG